MLNGSVSIVEPDLALMIVQNFAGLDVSAQDYGQPDYLKNRIAAVDNPETRALLSAIAARRITNVEEAATSADIQNELVRLGKRTKVSFARDMHARDLSEGNLILIGSRRSNPWNTLFQSRMNFQFIAGPDGQYRFRNAHPLQGEEKTYVPYLRSEGKLTSYVDICFTVNLTDSGYVLLTTGSDADANDAAARYLFHGVLRPDIIRLLQTRDLHGFELFLRGSHTESDGEVMFDLVSVRTMAG